MANSIEKYHYTQAELIERLREIGLKKGDIVFTHSGIGFLGYPKEAARPLDICRIIFEAFFEALGKEGTLVVPTFTYSFCRGEDFDPKNSPSTVGAFTEYVRHLTSSFRSPDPIFSVSAVGCKANEIVKNVSNECFGPGSIWDRLYNLNAAFLNIGISIGSTFIHYVEQTLGVPYRYKKLFSGYILEKGKKKKAEVIYFVRDLNHAEADPDFKKLDRDARELKEAKVTKVGKGELSLIRAKGMFELCREGLKRNPSYLVKGIDGKRSKSQTNKV